MLECIGLKKSYNEKYVVNDLSFNVNMGEVFAFLGNNGAGNTTTIKMILGLVKKDSGEIKHDDNILIGYSPETPYFPPFLTGYEVLDYYAFKDHIAPGSTLIHDKEKTHKKLVEKLNLKSVSYSSAELKGLADSENPLNTVNRIHCLLKMFLNAHSGFSRDDLQNYLNLYSFVINPPSDHLEKVEKIIKMVFENPKSLKYREQFVGIT